MSLQPTKSETEATRHATEDRIEAVCVGLFCGFGMGIIFALVFFVK